jgi:K+-transporting ATPase c subunit
VSAGNGNLGGSGLLAALAAKKAASAGSTADNTASRIAAAAVTASGMRITPAVKAGAAVAQAERSLADVVISPQIGQNDSKAAKPKRTSAKQVLFVNAHRPNIGFVGPSGHAVRFANGYLLTDDEALIKFVRDNAKAWRVTEESAPSSKQADQT